MGISKIIGHVNETIGHINESIQSVELESNKKTTMFMDKYKKTSSAYDTKGKENNLSTSEKK